MDADALQKGIHVSAGKDRFKKDDLKIWGLIPLSCKVSTKDTGGALYVFEHPNMGKGGPPAICTTSRTSGSTRSRGSSPSRSATRGSSSSRAIRCLPHGRSLTSGLTSATIRARC